MTTATRVRVLVRACRPRQWTKNLLVLTAPIAAGIALESRVAVAMGVAVVAFILASSGIYLINDVLDIETDRAHPTKRRRPVASGELPVRAAWVAAALLLPGALVISAMISWQLVVVVAVYEAVQLWYCLGMKHEPVFELTSVASGFLLRAIAGGVATHVELSQWFLIAAGFGSLFMAGGKRYAELRLAKDTTTPVRPVLRRYTLSYLRFVWTLSAGVLVTTYALWAFTISQATSNVWSVVSLVPFVVAVLRYAVDVDSGAAGEPEEVVLHDRPLLLLGVIWATCLIISVHL
ncbi:decaprenyl-phosphate phosphoribosyltransferase [mine drainage metagenome]|uniref:Decaprenyl-phosphate phosphoribosyltransferase n=1 Tax=mine drainage metagenome TaxID=410659 RepID=A0A1J5QQT0_9ZZZZ